MIQGKSVLSKENGYEQSGEAFTISLEEHQAAL